MGGGPVDAATGYAAQRVLMFPPADDRPHHQCYGILTMEQPLSYAFARSEYELPLRITPM